MHIANIRGMQQKQYQTAKIPRKVFYFTIISFYDIFLFSSRSKWKIGPRIMKIRLFFHSFLSICCILASAQYLFPFFFENWQRLLRVRINMKYIVNLNFSSENVLRFWKSKLKDMHFMLLKRAWRKAK